ncbi:MAG: hypothetical protein JKY95_00245 [Planctomycetaceae bacterium]|nr:hypothetical protein [Planctomycetaceae bacterium]
MFFEPFFFCIATKMIKNRVTHFHARRKSLWFSAFFCVLFFMDNKSMYIKQLKQRHSSLAWWVRMMRDHPGGVVPIPTAARMLSVTSNRVRQLIDDGRLLVVDGMPGGNERDRFIPVDQLIDAPFAMTRGRPGVWGPKNRENKETRNKIIDAHNSIAAKHFSNK